MNIALITDDFLPSKGGITNVIVNVSKNLTKNGEKVLIFNTTCNDESRSYFKILSSHNTLRSLKKQNKGFYFFTIKLLLKLIVTFKGDKLNNRLKLGFYYCFYPKNLLNRILSIKALVSAFKTHKIDVILSGKAAHPLIYSYVLSKWFNIPMITIAHGDDFITEYPFNINTIIFKNIEKIVVTNKVMRSLFLKRHKVNPDKVSIIHLGVDTIANQVKETKLELRNKFKISMDTFVILTVSRFYPRKGFDTVLKALKQITDELPSIPISYYIIGDGEDRQRIEGLIRELDLKKYVSMLGSLDDILKNQYYKLSDVFVLVPEVKKDSIEGFGIVYIEANFFKLPVIGSRSGGVKVAVEDGKSGFLINPKDAIGLKEKILNLYNNKDLREKLGDYGHQRVETYFNWQKNALSYKELLNQAIKEHNSNG